MTEPLIINDDLMLCDNFHDKDKIKSLGAKPHWDKKTFKGWYVPKGMNLNPFEKWWHPRFKEAMRLQNPKKEGDVKETGSRLSQILRDVKNAIEGQMSNAYWIQAEVVSVSGNAHTYLELADYDDNGKELAKSRGTIFASRKDILKMFEEQTGLPIKAGMKVLVQGYVKFSELYGFSIDITEIDSRFTVGDMEAKLLKIKAELTKKGILDSNKRLMPPKDFSRVAVIAPKEAAGLGDFKTQADGLHQFGLCEFVYFHAVFQGPQSIPTICAALDEVTRQIMVNDEKFDALVIIRGGGDKAGLYALNEYEIAYRVCTTPIPIYVGIGHERDNTLLDELACVRLPTPSLVISQIAGTIVQNAQNAREDLSLLKRLASDTINQAKLSLDNIRGLVVQESKQLVSDAKQNIASEKQSMISAAEDITVTARHEIKNGMTDLLYQDPKKIVDKGYGIIRKDTGKVTGNATDLNSDESITISLRDGDVKATVNQITKK